MSGGRCAFDPWIWIYGGRAQVQSASGEYNRVERGALISPQTLNCHWKIATYLIQRSSCHNHKAVNAVNTHWNNLESTGIGACACARHGCFVPHSVVDFQKGERYAKLKGTINSMLIIYYFSRQMNMDYSICNALAYQPEPVRYIIPLLYMQQWCLSFILYE